MAVHVRPGHVTFRLRGRGWGRQRRRLVARVEKMAGRDRGMTASRDLADELARFLTDHPGSLATELALAVRARKADVLATLSGDERFVRLPPPRGLPSTARPWGLAQRPVPASGEQREQHARAGDDSYLGWAFSELTGPSSGSHASGCSAPNRHRGWHWSAPRGRRLCLLCTPPSVSTAIGADSE